MHRDFVGIRPCAVWELGIQSIGSCCFFCQGLMSVGQVVGKMDVKGGSKGTSDPPRTGWSPGGWAKRCINLPLPPPAACLMGAIYGGIWCPSSQDEPYTWPRVKRLSKEICQQQGAAGQLHPMPARRASTQGTVYTKCPCGPDEPSTSQKGDIFLA